jgi:hypothetical protein
VGCSGCSGDFRSLNLWPLTPLISYLLTVNYLVFINQRAELLDDLPRIVHDTEP